MWLKTKDNLVNMDRVATVKIGSYSLNLQYVEASVQVTQSEEFAISPAIFTGNDWSCREFIKWLYEQLATGARVADVAEYLAAFQEDDAQQ